MPYATRDGLRLYYEQARDPARPPSCSCTAGAATTRSSSRRSSTSARSASATTYDLRGCGRSDQRDDYEVATLADDLAWLCDELGARQARRRRAQPGRRHRRRARGAPSVLAGRGRRRRPGAVRPAAGVPRGTLGAHRSAPRSDRGRSAADVRRGLFRPSDDLERPRRVAETMCSSARQVAAAMLRATSAGTASRRSRRCDVPLLVVLARTGGSNDPARLAGAEARPPDRRHGRRRALPPARRGRAADADDRAVRAGRAVNRHALVRRPPEPGRRALRAVGRRRRTPSASSCTAGTGVRSTTARS